MKYIRILLNSALEGTIFVTSLRLGVGSIFGNNEYIVTCLYSPAIMQLG